MSEDTRQKDVIILVGDVRAQLKTLDDDSIDCVVCSPPYWGLRDYGVEGQLGLEPTLDEHLRVMVEEVFADIWRVLKPEGTCWVNYGDCYASSVNGRKAADIEGDDRTFRDKPFSTVGGVLKPKDLCMMPNRFAIKMQEFGWWVRSEIVWHKPNPMPESAKDRPHSAHEKVWLFTKSMRNFYDQAAVRQEIKPKTLTTLGANARPRQVRGDQIGTKAANWQNTPYKMPDGWDTSQGAHGTIHAEGREQGKRVHRSAADDRAVPPKHKGQINHQSLRDVPTGGANLKNVWTIAPRPFSQAHFATYPVELAEMCIAAGCPKGGVVLDPFGGAGTTALAAKNLGRSAILIELNEDYAQIAADRLRGELCTVKGVEQVTSAGPLFDTREAAE